MCVCVCIYSTLTSEHFSVAKNLFYCVLDSYQRAFRELTHLLTADIKTGYFSLCAEEDFFILGGMSNTTNVAVFADYFTCVWFGLLSNIRFVLTK